MDQMPGFSAVLRTFGPGRGCCHQARRGSDCGRPINRQVVHSLILDLRKILPFDPTSRLYDIRDVCLSVPTVVGNGGVRQQLELALTPKERLGLTNSAKVLRDIIEQVESRIGGKQSKTGAGAPARTTAGRAIPRSAWQVAR